MLASGPTGTSSRAGWIVLAVLVVGLLWVARDVLGPFIVAAVIAYAFSDPVNAAQARTGWPRAAIIGLGYVAVLAIALVGLALLAGPTIAELNSLVASGPDALAVTLRAIVRADVIEIAGRQVTIDAISRAVENQLSGLTSTDAIRVATEASSFLLDAFLVLVVTFYLLVDGQRLIDRALLRVPVDRRVRIVELLDRVDRTLGHWLRGELVLIAFVAAVVYVVLGPILHVPHALAVALLTGVLEIIPLIGPVVATVIAAVNAFAAAGPVVAGVVVVFYAVLRLVEDQVVMPQVIGRVVHLHPVVTIFAVLVGLSVYGVLGGLLGVPVAAAANVLFNELFPPLDGVGGVGEADLGP